MTKTAITLLNICFYFLLNNTSFGQKELNLFYISGSAHEQNSELRISDKQLDQFSEHRKQLKDKSVLAYFNNLNYPVITSSFRDEDIGGFMAAIHDSASREEPDYASVNAAFRDHLYSQESGRDLDRLIFHFFMSARALENAAVKPEASLYSLPAEILHVLGAPNAHARVILYYDKSKLTISEDEIYAKLSFYMPGEKVTFQFNPL